MTRYTTNPKDWRASIVKIEEAYPHFKEAHGECCLVENWESDEQDYAVDYARFKWLLDEPYFEDEGYLDRYRNGESKESLYLEAKDMLELLNLRKALFDAKAIVILDNYRKNRARIQGNRKRLDEVKEKFSKIYSKLPQQHDSDDLSFLAVEHEQWSDLRKVANDEILGDTE